MTSDWPAMIELMLLGSALVLLVWLTRPTPPTQSNGGH